MAPAKRDLTVREASSVGRFKRFALDLYRRPGVADACLALQSRHDLDVNVVLFAAFAGAAQRRALTADDLMQAHRRVDAWHQEIVRPLRAVRQRLKAGPAPAPSEATGRLRRKLAQIEIEAEMIELDQLGSLIPETGPERPVADPAACAAAAIETVVTTRTGTALIDEDRGVIEAIAAAAQQVDAGRSRSSG
jgi:uncharacterized protein (TIGR02444 family)